MEDDSDAEVQEFASCAYALLLQFTTSPRYGLIPEAKNPEKDDKAEKSKVGNGEIEKSNQSKIQSLKLLGETNSAEGNLDSP